MGIQWCLSGLYESISLPMPKLYHMKYLAYLPLALAPYVHGFVCFCTSDPCLHQ